MQFNVGDKVRIKHVKLGSYSNDGCYFAHSMGVYRGTITTIKGIHLHDSNRFTCANNSWWWSPEWLEKVPEIKVIRRRL